MVSPGDGGGGRVKRFLGRQGGMVASSNHGCGSCLETVLSGGGNNTVSLRDAFPSAKQPSTASVNSIISAYVHVLGD